MHIPDIVVDRFAVLLLGVCAGAAIRLSFVGNAGSEPDGLRWTATAIVLATGLLALFNAQALTGWAEELPPGPTSVKLVAAASAWEETTAALGTGHARMHKAWKQLERAEWSPRAPEVQEARR